MKNRILRLMDYIFITRPILFFPGWTTLLLGYLVVNPNLGIFVCAPPEQKLLMALIAFAAMMGSTFILNQIQDKDTDELNQKCFFIGKGMISLRQATNESMVLAIIAVLLSVWVGTLFLYGIVAFYIITGYFYNFKPFVWKNRPIAGLIGNILMGWIAFFLGVVLLSSHFNDFTLRAIPYILLNTSLYIFTTLPDREGDRASGKMTIGVMWSFKTNIIFGFLLFFIGFVAAFFLQDKVAITIFAGSTFHYLKLMKYQSVAEVIKTTKWTLFISALVVCAFFPWFIIWIILGYTITKFYYRERFSLDYPNFRGE